ncbi:S8 family serine peptidase [Streptomyces sp. Q6]|uniref:S8 family serine peptidase n=1 Tax=Streptomyces citrinus TaxID=3118173 RepID=A0ACD5ALU1_9ACTN
MRQRRGRRRRTAAPRTWALLLSAGLAVAGLPAMAATTSATPHEDRPAVESKVRNALADGGTSTFWVYLKDHADLRSAARIKDRARQGRTVRDRLVRTARDSQAGLLDVLGAAHAPHTSYWIANTVRVKGDATLLKKITALPDVDRVAADRTYALPAIRQAEAEPTVDDVEWGVDRIGAPKAWKEFGATGQGIVVGSIDSGVQFDHPALARQYRGSKADGTVTHAYNWYDPQSGCAVIPSLSKPCDTVGHGTHTVGTMVGDGGAGQHIGVAPGARWIAAKGCGGSTCTQSGLLASGQFMLAPTDLDGRNPRPELRPHVVNNSWGSSDAGADPWFQQTVRAWVAAGIFPVFSNGNEGPECGTDANPANLPESYGVGAFDADGNIAAFSSRGPSENGHDLIKPDVSAPGVAVRSAYPGGKYAVGSGTSMAAPHVAGAIALLWSAAPAVARNIDATRRLLDETAVDVDATECGGTPTDNNVYGQGRLDAYAAVEKAPRGAVGTLTGTVTDAATGDPVAGATVALRDDSGPVGLAQQTDADGHYAMLASVGDYTVSASAPAYGTEKAVAHLAEGTTATADLTLGALPGRHLEVALDRAGFGTVPIGTTGGPATVTLTGTGADPVTVRQITDHDGAFVSETGTCGPAPFTLARKEHCTLGITYRPTEKGEQTGTLTIDSDAAEAAPPLAVHGSGTTMPARTATLRMRSFEKNMHAAVIDPQGRYAYFGTDNAPDPLSGYIVKFDLKTFERVGVIPVGIGQKLLQDAVIDPSGTYAYFVAAANPGRVVRVDLDTFTLDRITPLATGADNPRSILMDPAGRYAYIGTGTNPGRVIKFDLETFAQVGSVTLGKGEDFLDDGVIDSRGRYAYFGTVTSPQGHVVKVDLAEMKETGSLTLEPGEGPLRTAVVAPDDHYAYFGTGEGARGKIVRVDLTTFERAGAITPSGGGTFYSSVMDPAGRFASFGTVSSPGRVVTVDLKHFTAAGTVTLGANEDALISAAIDPRGEYAYFGTQSAPGRVVKVRLGASYELTARGSRVRGVHSAALTWNGATTAKIEVVRNGKVIATVPNTGRSTDVVHIEERPTYTYQLCDAGTEHCSNTSKVDFTGPPAGGTDARTR